MSDHALQESEERYRNIVDDFTGFIVRWLPGGKRTFISDSYCQYFGITREQAKTNDFMDLVYPPDRDSVQMRIKNLTKENPVTIGEHRGVHADGSLRWMEWTDRVLFDAQGQIKEYQSIGFDIHERKQTSELLHQAKLDAEHASQTKSRFLATMSHEIRTPLNCIIGYIDLLQTTALTAQQRKYADRVTYSSKLLVTLLSDVLEASRLETRELTFEPKWVEVSALIDDTIKMCHLDAEKKGLTIAFRKEMPVATYFDPKRLQQIILNLLNNAIKFTEQGSITVTATKDEQQQMLRITVKDTGIGIAKEDQEKIFDSFFQVDMSATRQHEGAGLGLYLVKRILDANDSKITVQSEVGVGTEFLVQIPIRNT